MLMKLNINVQMSWRNKVRRPNERKPLITSIFTADPSAHAEPPEGKRLHGGDRQGRGERARARPQRRRRHHGNGPAHAADGRHDAVQGDPQDRAGHAGRAAVFILPGDLPEDRIVRTVGHRLRFLLEQLHRPADRHNQTAGGQPECRQRPPGLQRTGDPAGGRFHPLLLHLSAGALQHRAPAESGVDQGHAERAAADRPQAFTS